MQTVQPALQILRPLIGLPIWNVRRSHGSCFLAEFGPLKEHKTLPVRVLANGQVIPERKVKIGVWSLLVEQCQWSIQSDGSSSSHSDTSHIGMQKTMLSLENRIVSNVVFDEWSLTIDLAPQARVRLGPADGVDLTYPGDQWSFILPDGRRLARNTANALELS